MALALYKIPVSLCVFDWLLVPRHNQYPREGRIQKQFVFTVKIHYILRHTNNLLPIQLQGSNWPDKYHIAFQHSVVPVTLENIHEFIPVVPLLHTIGSNSLYYGFKQLSWWIIRGARIRELGILICIRTSLATNVFMIQVETRRGEKTNQVSKSNLSSCFLSKGQDRDASAIGARNLNWALQMGLGSPKTSWTLEDIRTFHYIVCYRE